VFESCGHLSHPPGPKQPDSAVHGCERRLRGRLRPALASQAERNRKEPGWRPWESLAIAGKPCSGSVLHRDCTQRPAPAVTRCLNVGLGTDFGLALWKRLVFVGQTMKRRSFLTRRCRHDDRLAAPWRGAGTPMIQSIALRSLREHPGAQVPDRANPDLPTKRNSVKPLIPSSGRRPGYRALAQQPGQPPTSPTPLPARLHYTNEFFRHGLPRLRAHAAESAGLCDRRPRRQRAEIERCLKAWRRPRPTAPALSNTPALRNRPLHYLIVTARPVGAPGRN